MSAEPASLSPPYIGYTAFVNFLNELKETSIPARIDRSVFGNMSGGQAYGILSALKFLKLVEGDGAVRPELRRMVASLDDDRPAALRDMLKSGYPTLWDGSIDLASATSGQFDEHLRDRYDVKGSTLDRAATFFLAAAADANVEISHHLRTRKAVSTPSSRRPAKPKRQGGGEGEVKAPPPAPPTVTSQKADPVSVLVSIIDMAEMDQPEQDAVWTLIRYLKKREAKERAMEASA